MSEEAAFPCAIRAFVKRQRIVASSKFDGYLWKMRTLFSQPELALIRDLQHSDTFDRLRDISFLGVIDHYKYPSQKNKQHRFSQYRFSRADHTLGVLELAGALMSEIEFSSEERLILISASICHDIGHSAFSHSLENAFREINPKIDHKFIMSKILNDPDNDIHKIIISNNIDILRVNKLSIGDKNDNLNWIFHNPINIDTIDGIYRFLLSFKLPPPFIPINIVKYLSYIYKHKELHNNNIDEIDRFWNVKSGFYEHFLVDGIFAKFEKTFVDRVISRVKTVSEEDYFVNEQSMFDFIEWEKDNLVPETPDMQSPPRRSTSHFEIDFSVVLQSTDDLYRRYRRLKIVH